MIGFVAICVAAGMLIMLFLVILVYWQYLTGQKVYVFTDVASDSAGQTYPNLIYLAREISLGNWGDRWNFVSSIGNSAQMILPKLANLEAFLAQTMWRILWASLWQ